MNPSEFASVLPPDSSRTSQAAIVLSHALRLHPLVAEVLWRRGHRTLESARAFLDPASYTAASPFDLPDMSVAVERLQRAIQQQEPIRVWGDFDVDGQTSTSLLTLGLRALGARADYTIPNRAFHSHGLNKPSLQKARDEGIQLILTCDCGVTDFEDIAFARSLGLEVIITDHHDLAIIDNDAGPMLPDALAIVNPKRLPSSHPLIHLPGVGAAYKLIEALNQRNAELGLPTFDLTSLLDLVAIGIVGDLAIQKADTRYLLQLGLQQLRRDPRPGIRALLRAANVNPAALDSDTIGYQIGPRLNAAGRLDSAELSVQLLTANTDGEAGLIANRMETLNNERKVLQRAIEHKVLRMLEQHPELAQREAIVLESPDWPPSVIGVVANGIVERYGRPVALIAVQPGEEGRGSARSVPGVDIHAAISAQASFIVTSGGHPMAAGFAIHSHNVAAFTEGLIQHVANQRTGHAAPVFNATSTLSSRSAEASPSDTYPVVLRDATLELAEHIERLAPFGAGNPRPSLRAGPLRIMRAEPLGADGRHQMLHVQDGNGTTARAAWWKGGGQPVPTPDQQVSLVFNLRRSVYQGKTRAQLEVVALELVTEL